MSHFCYGSDKKCDMSKKTNGSLDTTFSKMNAFPLLIAAKHSLPHDEVLHDSQGV